MVKKVYISQPMRGKNEDEIKDERIRITDTLVSMYGVVDVVDSHFVEFKYNQKPLYYLGKSFELLSTADVAFFARGWKESRGCLMEHEACLVYGIPVVIEEDLR